MDNNPKEEIQSGCVPKVDISTDDQWVKATSYAELYSRVSSRGVRSSRWPVAPCGSRGAAGQDR